MALKRVFAGFYKRYDGKPIFVVRVLKDIDTGESIVVCKDASFSKEDNEHYYLIRYTSFCEQVEVDGVRRDKYVRQTRREIDEGTVREVYEDGFPEPKSKPFTYVDDEYAERAIRCSRTYYESVSYTHLDVYKRQAMSCVILLLMRNMVSFQKVWCDNSTLTHEALFLIPFLFNCPRCIVVLHFIRTRLQSRT